MKRLLYLWMASVFILSSCSSNDNDIDNPDDPDNPSSVSLELSTSDLVFMAEKGEKEFTISCNSDWTITNESQWCKTDETRGNGNATIKVTVDAYSDTEDRNTNLTIKAGDKTEVLTVTQKHGDAIIFSKSKFEVPQDGGNITIEVESNIDYVVTIPTQFRSWIQKAPESKALETKNFSFIISANEEEDSRNGYILFSGNSLTDTVHIYQAQKNRLVLTESTYTIPKEGQEIIVELKTNVDYEVNIPGAAASWISQINTKAIRTDRLQFRIAASTENTDRSAKITIKDKNSSLSDTIRISQPFEKKDIIWKTEQDLIDFKTAGHTRIQGNIIVQGEEIKTLQKLDNLLTEIDGSLTLACSSLTSLDGLYGLTKITGDFIVEKGEMVYFEGLENLSMIEGNFEVNATWSNSLSYLISFKGLSGLKKIGGDFIAGNSDNGNLNKLESFEGLENLEMIGGNFNVIASASYSFTALTSFKGLNGLKNIGGDFQVNASGNESLTALESFKGLENLEKIEGSFKVVATESYSLTALTSFEGLSGLKSIGGVFEVNANSSYFQSKYGSLTALESFLGLENLVTIGGNFKVIASSDRGTYLNALTSLTSFEGLYSLKSIGGDFEVNATSSEATVLAALTALKSFKGLENLETIRGNFKVIASSDNDSYLEALTSLTSFKGLSGLKSIGGDFEVNATNTTYQSNSLTALKSFEGMENLETIGGSFKVFASSYSSLSALTSFKGLNKLYSIGGNFEINNYDSDFNNGRLSALKSFEGLEKLGTIGGKKLIINDCKSLITLDNLSKVTALDDISIEGCGKLYDFCVLKNLVQNMSGTFYVATCGYNPTKYQLLNGACSQTPSNSNND